MKPRRIILNWRHDATRAIVPVAELIAAVGSQATRYEFGYVEGVRTAMELGFQPFLAFPHLHRRYSGSELFPFFRNRVLPTTRPDYLDYVEALGLSRETANVVDLLGRSEGRRRTDRIETVLAAERDPETGSYVTRFLVRGVRHVSDAESAISRLRVSSELEAVLEPANAVNPRARQLRLAGDAIGYVADYLLSDVDALEAAAAEPRFTVERVNPPPHPAHHRVLVRLEAAWPEGFEPFSAAKFQPYRAEGAAPLPLVG